MVLNLSWSTPHSVCPHRQGLSISITNRFNDHTIISLSNLIRTNLQLVPPNSKQFKTLWGCDGYCSENLCCFHNSFKLLFSILRTGLDISTFAIFRWFWTTSELIVRLNLNWTVAWNFGIRPKLKAIKEHSSSSNIFIELIHMPIIRQILFRSFRFSKELAL